MCSGSFGSAAPALERSGLRRGGLGDGVAAGWIVRRQRAWRRMQPAAGALAGIAKTAGQEWANVHCKAIDLDHDFDVPEAAAHLIVDEMLRHGPCEVGLSRQGRIVLTLEPCPKPGSAAWQTRAASSRAMSS